MSLSTKADIRSPAIMTKVRKSHEGAMPLSRNDHICRGSRKSVIDRPRRTPSRDIMKFRVLVMSAVRERQRGFSKPCIANLRPETGGQIGG